MKQYILTCPKCKNTEDFRKEVQGVVAITTISPIVEDGETYFDDRPDVDVAIYPFPEETGGVVEIYCNKCEFCFHYGPDCNDEGLLINYFIKQNWLKEIE
jgi:hypothetical protein